MRFSDYLAPEWRPALGCTEPASIAYAAASASAQASGPIRRVRLVCDPRIYKNCYAVGIPHSGHRVGLRWALAIGSLLPDPSLKLECFRLVNDALVEQASELLRSCPLEVKVDSSQDCLYIDCTVERESGWGRAIIEKDHTRLVHIENASGPVALPDSEPSSSPTCRHFQRALLSELSFAELMDFARDLSDDDRAKLRQGIADNLAIANHGLALFPARFAASSEDSATAGAGRLVCAGVYARMWGEDYAVMSLAGSGNKGIVCSVPLALYGKKLDAPQARIEEALALACVITSLTTHHLGTLSAVCGCSNAAGIGLAAGLVLLEGGGPKEISLAINNMVGNVTGMVCDGAKIGCALKTMTAVDAAFRAASLALSGIGIPLSDGIVGADGRESLANLGRIATQGMTSVDAEILQIMQDKMN